jgi:hypothetical protein
MMMMRKKIEFSKKGMSKYPNQKSHDEMLEFRGFLFHVPSSRLYFYISWERNLGIKGIENASIGSGLL